jgi:hypothetical protein
MWALREGAAVALATLPRLTRLVLSAATAADPASAEEVAALRGAALKAEGGGEGRDLELTFRP